ncbi:MAG: hypothetical protein COB49_02695 [Alphaproteobacteria bacterium]|nr:MAG: hypothetical protein COB49_02695 [Alphaproteobacteria bacterium]
MTRNRTFKAISLATVIAVTAGLGGTAFAHDISPTGEKISPDEKPSMISKSNARNLVRTLLKREYNGEGYTARPARKIDGKWVITIKDRTRTVATASVDAKTGNIHLQ